MIKKKAISILERYKINKVNLLAELKKFNNLDIILLDDFLDKYLTEISTFIDNYSDEQIQGLFNIDRNNEVLINKVVARELGFKCLYYTDEGDGDYNVDAEYIYGILEDYDNSDSHYSIVLAVDNSSRKDFKTRNIIKSTHKKGSKYRRKINKRYSYDNPFHRIHGYIITEDYPCKCKTDKILALTVICASPFSSVANIKAVGTYLMCFFVLYCKLLKYKYAILEVANDEAHMPNNNNNSNDLYDQDSLEKYRVIELKQILKEMSLPISGVKQILIDRILDSQDTEDTECSSSYNNRMELEENLNKNNLDEYGYGGIFYHKGRDKQRNLYCNFYEKFGFREDPDINKYWKCFSNSPYPSMILKLQNVSLECLVSSFINRKWTKKPTDYCSKYTRNVSISKKC